MFAAVAGTAHPPLAEDVVLQWNDLAVKTLQMDRSRVGPTQAARSMAIVQISVFDAINAIRPTYAPILVRVHAASGADPRAAAAAAAYCALSTLYPQQKRSLDKALRQTLARVPDGKSESLGVQLGLGIARRVLAARHNDGGDVIDNDTFIYIDPTTGIAPTIDTVTYPPGAPGEWRPDPLNPTQRVLGKHWGLVAPFVMDSVDEFAPPQPPALDSPEYAAAYNEVKTIGSKDSTIRTAEQTEIGKFWAYDRIFMGSPVALYNQVVHSIARQEGNTLRENARLFALANVAMVDAGIAGWACKFADNFWRPITAIRNGDADNNPDTAADPAWKPLGAPGDGVVFDFTPPFPSYVSGHSTFGAAIFGTLKEFYHTDNATFTLSSDELPGVRRTYQSFSQASQENGISRIYLGIHWSFDNTQGQKLGEAVANLVAAQVAQPLPGVHPSR